jgi:hypothetical protein
MPKRYMDRLQLGKLEPFLWTIINYDPITFELQHLREDDADRWVERDMRVERDQRVIIIEYQMNSQIRNEFHIGETETATQMC